MSQSQSMKLKPSAQLVTRLFLTPKLTQSLTVLSFNTYELNKMLYDFAESNPFVSLKIPQNSEQEFSWISDKKGESLVDHLLAQVRLSDWHRNEQKAVQFLIYNLDRDGYLRTELSKLATESEFDYSNLIIAKEYLHQLDPIGVGAKDLNECLYLQACKLPNFDDVALDILKNNQLEILADSSKWYEFSWDEEKINIALAAIQNLNPTPASTFYQDDITEYLIPDLIFKFNEGSLIVQDSFQQLPELVFDEHSYKEFKEKIDISDQNYLTKQRQMFIDMNNAIAQRKNTLLTIGKLVGKKQYEFFKTQQSKDLKPLTMTQVAQELNLSVSTISRAIKDKYVQSSGKVFSLRKLFPKFSNNNYSQEKIKHKLKELIKNEDKENPLSDDQIVLKFKKDNIVLSRRVITKYRNSLGIDNSYRRKINTKK